MERRLPPLHALPSEKIDELINDLRLRQAGAKLYYVIDPMELSEFCFPINPLNFRKQDINSIADDQAALYEIFFLRKEPPLLLQDYDQEIENILDYFEHTVDNVYTKVEMIEAFIKEGGLEKIGERNYELKGDLLDLVEEDFNVMLAVAMGIYSLGITRFKDVLEKRIVRNGLGIENPEIKEIYGAYNTKEHIESDIVQVMLHEFEKSYRENDKDKKEPYALMDALAISRILYLNSAFEKAFKDGKLTQRHIVLYLSSAPRTARAFRLKELRESLPNINGKPYPIWRSRSQIFAYVVHKSREKNLTESIKNLVHVRNVLEEVEQVGHEFMHSVIDCSKCVLDGGKDEHCKWLNFCQKVNDLDVAIHARRAEIQNLALVNQLNNYNLLIRRTPKKKSHQDYITFFSQFYTTDFNLRAMKRMHELQWLVHTKSEFAKQLPSALGIGKSGSERTLLREGRDAIIGLSQYLPLRPRIKSEKYQPIIELILNCYRIPPQGVYKLDLIDRAYTRYIGIDAEIDKLDLIHELVRCLLYLAFPKINGDKKAFEHAEKMLKEKDLLEQTSGIEAEYLYVMLWAARRLRKYEDADKAGRSSIQNWPKDPRFYHGISLNIYSWLMDEEHKDSCKYKVKDAIDAAKQALTLFFDLEATESIEDEDIELIAANFNNIAYFWAHLSKDKNCSDKESQNALVEARRALTEMKRWVVKETWMPNHPEYFHTEAFVEYEEYIRANKENKEIEILIQKLENALREIDIAVRLYPKRSYIDFKDQIESDLSSLRNRNR